MTGPTWRLDVGHVLDRLADYPDGSVQCAISSFPYWGLRVYEGLPPVEWPAMSYVPVAGAAPIEVPAMTCCWGNEPTLHAFLAHTVHVTAEIGRVLRPDGTLWLNHGDAYACKPPGNARPDHSGGKLLSTRGRQPSTAARGAVPKRGKSKRETEANKARAKAKGYDVGAWGASDGAAEGFDRSVGDSGLGPKQRQLQPHRLALALQAAGWLVRSEIVWAKGVSFCPTYAGSCMPSSVRDRPTDAHETVFLLAKSRRYFYDADAVREAAKYGRREHSAPLRSGEENGDGHRSGGGSVTGGDPSAGRNLRTVWTVNPGKGYTAPGVGAQHFATFPERLIEPMIRAGTSEHGACSECGAPWRRVVEASGGAIGEAWHDHANDGNRGQRATANMSGYSRTTTGWEPTCEHADAERVPCVVFDPCTGTGTTGAVALRLGRSFLGTEASPAYAAVACRRLADVAYEASTPLFGAL